MSSTSSSEQEDAEGTWATHTGRLCLVQRLHHLEAKDLVAFRCVIELTGHPTAEELRLELQSAVDLFRPSFDEESPNRFPANVMRLWQELWGAPLDLRKAIIVPALERRQRGYHLPKLDYKVLL